MMKLSAEASRQEIIRRYFKTACEYKKGQVDKGAYERIKYDNGRA